MSIVALNSARHIVRQAGPDQLYLLQHPDHMEETLRAAGIDPVHLTPDEHDRLRQSILALWAEHGTSDESKG